MMDTHTHTHIYIYIYPTVHVLGVLNTLNLGAGDLPNCILYHNAISKEHFENSERVLGCHDSIK